MLPTHFSRRSVLLGAGAASAAIGVGACTGPSASQTTASDAAGGAGGQLSLMLLGPTETLISHLNDNVLPAFKEATNYAVELQTSDWGSAFQKITTGAASNSLPDAFIIGGIWTAPLASRNVLMDLTARFADWDEADQFYDGMLADAKYQDTLYAIPFSADVRSGIYRTDLLEEAGVAELPTTWQEFRAAAEAVRALGTVQSPIDWNLDNSIGLQQSFAQLFLQAGGEYFDADGNANFNSEAGRKALEFMVGTFQDGLADYNVVWSGNGPRPIVSGLSAMTLNGSAVPSNARDSAPEVEENLAAGPGLRADEGSAPTSVAWINKFSIAESTPDPDGAWQLLQFLTSGENMSEITQLYGGLPTRQDLADAEWIDGIYADLMATANDATSQPAHPTMMQLGPEVKNLLEPAIRGTAGVEETLDAINAAVDGLSA